MNKFYLPILTLICCTQNIQSMGLKQQMTGNSPQNDNENFVIIKLTELTQQQRLSLYFDQLYSPENNKPRFIEIKVDRWDIKTGEHFFLPQAIDTLSEKLYTHNITENEIDELVQQGADVNYKPPRHDRFSLDTKALPLYFAMNKTEQGVKNMQAIIKHSAKLHNIPGTIETPLEVALEHNNLPMIQLLLPYENPILKPYKNPINGERIRELAIHKSFINENIESIKTLLEIGLITANQGLNEVMKYAKPNQEIINYLINSGANNYNSVLYEVTKKALQCCSPYVQMVHCLTDRGAFNEDTFQVITLIKDMTTKIHHDLEKNKALKDTKK